MKWMYRFLPEIICICLIVSSPNISPGQMILPKIPPKDYINRLFISASDIPDSILDYRNLPGQKFEDGLNSKHSDLHSVFSHCNQHAPQLEWNSEIFGDVRLAWVHQLGSGIAPGYEEAVDAVLTDSAKFIVTGYSTSPETGTDYLTRCYNSGGAVEWSSRFTSTGYNEDIPAAIATARDNSIVFVTGLSWQPESGYEILTVCYDSLGSEVWHRRYQSGSIYDQHVSDAVVDSSGNLVLTGWTRRPGKTFDYLTLKYSPGGNLLWSEEFNGPGNSSDRAVALGVTSKNSIIVTGFSFEAGSGYNFRTVKYDSTGAVISQTSFDGADHLEDRPVDLKIDPDGNIVVAGYSAGSDSQKDIAIVKYDSNLVEVWRSIFDNQENLDDFPASLSINPAGDIYVCGTTETMSSSYDFLLLKYDLDGHLQWSSQYNGSGNSYDEPVALTIDASGGIALTGYSYNVNEYDLCVLKYDSSGMQTWQYHYASDRNNIPVKISRSSAGDYFIGGYSGSFPDWDFLVHKINANGSEVWDQIFDGPGNSLDQAAAISVNSDGNLTVSGNSSKSNGIESLFTIGYDESGNLLWSDVYGEQNENNIHLTAMSSAVSGNIYLTGFEDKPGSGEDIFLIKYSPQGIVEWRSDYNGPDNGKDRPAAILIDPDENVFIGGFSEGVNTNYDYLLLKYDHSGQQKWFARYDGTASAEDVMTTLTIDGSGNLLVSGISRGIGTYFDIATLKYSSEGTPVWIQRFNSAANDWDAARSITTDENSNTYVLGESNIPGQLLNFSIVKYSPSGQLLWNQSFNGDDNNEDYPVKIMTQSTGGVVAAGYSFSYNTVFDYLLLSYDSEGNLLWKSLYNGPGNNLDAVTDMALDQTGNVYITGYSLGEKTHYDIATLVYNPDGKKLSESRFSGSGSYVDYPTSLQVDPQKNLYITGFSESFASLVYTTLKYQQNSQTIIKENAGRAKRESPGEIHVFPNPFNGATTLNLKLQVRSHVRLEIYNLIGERVTTLLDTEKQPGEFSFHWRAENLASGVYLYVFTIKPERPARNSISRITGKLLLLK